jgi:hypothetical protein
LGFGRAGGLWRRGISQHQLKPVPNVKGIFHQPVKFAHHSTKLKFLRFVSGGSGSPMDERNLIQSIAHRRVI